MSIITGRKSHLRQLEEGSEYDEVDERLDAERLNDHRKVTDSALSTNE